MSFSCWDDHEADFDGTCSPSSSKDHPEASIDAEEAGASNDSLLDFGDEIITILVGPEHARYTVHAEQLKKSLFFKNAIKEPWLVDRTISLPIDGSVTLHYYIHFLYASQVPATNFEDLADLYVYGEKVVDLHFKHEVVKAMIRLTRQVQEDGKCYYPVTQAVDAIYAGTLDGSPGRQLLVDIFSVYGTPSWIGDYEYNAAFLKDLVLRRMREYEGDRVMYGHEIVADRYLEKHDGTPLQLEQQQRENPLASGSQCKDQLHPRLSPDSRTALAAYNERLRLQETTRQA